MRFFLSFTAVIEAITGVGLLFFPGWLVSFLMQRKYGEPGGIIIAMIAGAAIISLAACCWLFRNHAAAFTFSKILLVYNSILVCIVIFAVIYFEMSSVPFFVIGGFHLFQALWDLKLLLTKQVFS
jgi:hypothetical protein